MLLSLIEILCVALGVFMLVLVAMKNIWTFVVGMVQVALMSFANYLNYEYVQALFHIVYLFPMQFVGLWLWRDRGADLFASPQLRRVRCIDHGVVKRIVFYTIGIFSVLTPFVYGVASLLKNAGVQEELLVSAVLVESLVITLNIVGQVMMSLALIEQWYLWIVVNVITMGMCMQTLLHQDYAVSSVSRMVMSILYFVVSLVGLFIWKRSRRNRMKVGRFFAYKHK